ncbi:MAG: hypothetical protein J6Y94_06585 [Bacteriovoracaceae bacterium]|nr:hypothetical protein [Bacteriovoracaceae bacterium]
MKICIFLSAFLLSFLAYGQDFVIYSVAQEVAMQNNTPPPPKNYFVNLGKNQGIKPGTILNVERIISEIDPFKAHKRFNHQVKIGELKVIHSEDESSIAVAVDYDGTAQGLAPEYTSLMIGDRVHVKLDR